MNFNLAVPTGNGQAIDLNFDRGHLSGLDFLSGHTAYGSSPWAGASTYSDVGFGRDGMHVGGGATEWNPGGVANQQWGTNGFSSFNRSSSMDNMGDYSSHSYASNVFGGYRESNTVASPWGYSQNVEGGPGFCPPPSYGGCDESYGGPRPFFGGGNSCEQYGGGGLQISDYNPYVQNCYRGCGGPQVNMFFGGGGGWGHHHHCF